MTKTTVFVPKALNVSFIIFLQRSFIPTMPQDDLADIKEALLAGRGRDCNENPVLYRKYYVK